ncbi:CoA transferase [Verminephrobacter aporrectodeae subsp. tuberculatae]|uniref:CaiB/BaiF CoA transferase family protein n=1 Tax=Verminephrobacter aporrectodeae TaxID=1110389 RepID=UPI0002377EA0|nr:CoA transferase [Verminephrobacter aporrectodeae]MCW8164888.1 CoA transferase [Verminephrobacter aporrectodeae subsp. tuberculatae]MCW8168637.1 CoA transferase [Verminephrobacter aporrectodeae subsp. tuberculatae]
MTDSTSSAACGPLKGIRVLDLTAVVLGPLATQILADYGADVIKVEPPEGDMMRANGISQNPGMSSIFLAVNRNKRSLAVDLKSAAGVTALRALIPTIDVVVHNMRVAAIERLGLGYEAVSRLNPRVVYCAATGFGQDGPHRDRPAFDDIIQAACGLVGVGSVGRDQPDYAQSLIADKTTGLAVCNAVLAALLHRERSGEGQYVEVPMLETMAAFVLAEHMGGMTFQGSTVQAGYPRLLEGGRKPVRTRDGWVSMLPYTERHWQAFFFEVGQPELADRYNIASRQERNTHVKALYGHLRELTPLKTTAEWMLLCEKLDIPATPIYTLDELPEHPHLKAVGLFEDATHPTEGPIRQLRPTARFSATPTKVYRQAPTVGQHTTEILREAGLAQEDIARLKDRRVVIGE